MFKNAECVLTKSEVSHSLVRVGVNYRVNFRVKMRFLLSVQMKDNEQTLSIFLVFF